MSTRFSGRRSRRFRRWIANRAARWRLPQAPRSCEIARIARVPRQPVHNGYGCNQRIKAQAARARAAYTTSMARAVAHRRPPRILCPRILLSENSAILRAEVTIDPQSLRRTLRGRRVVAGCGLEPFQQWCGYQALLAQPHVVLCLTLDKCMPLQ